MRAGMEGSRHPTREQIVSMLSSLKKEFIEKKLAPTFLDILQDAGLNVVEFTYTIPLSEISASVKAKRNRISNAPVYEISFPLRFKISVYAGKGTISLTLMWWVTFALTHLPTQEWGVVDVITHKLQLGDSLIQILSPSSLSLTENQWWGRTPLEERTPVSLERLVVKESTLDALAHALIATIPAPTNVFLQLVERAHHTLLDAISNTPPVIVEDTSPYDKKRINVNYILTPTGSLTPNLFMQPLVDYDEVFMGLSLGASVDTEIAITLIAPSEKITIQKKLRCTFTLKFTLRDVTYDDETDEEIESEGSFVVIMLEARAAPPVSIAHAEIVHSVDIKSSQDIMKVTEGLSKITPQRIAELVKRLHETIVSPRKFEELFGQELS